MSVKCILTEQGGKGGGSGKVTLISIEVATQPTKTSYYSGETFNPAGLVLTANYGQGSVIMGTKTIEAGAEGLTYSPTTLTDGTTSVTATYVDDGVTATCGIPVTVTHVVRSIAVTTNPTKTSYEYGDSFATAGMVVKATYSDNTTATVTGYSTSPSNGATLSTVSSAYSVTVSYTENGYSASTSFNIVVARKSVAKPTWKSSAAPTYGGNSINVASGTYWNNWNTTYFGYSGCSATNAGTHTATFTPNSNYRWSDGSTTAINVDWTIKQKAPTFSLSSSSVAIDASNYENGVTVTITYDGDGTLAVSGNVTGLTATLSGKTITIKGNGTTATSTTFTVSATAGTNYSKPSNLTISASATYWEWGTESTIGDAAWWAGLKAWAAGATVAERKACEGKKKKVSLSTAVLGANAINMVCIGADFDGVGTLTFQSESTLPTQFAYSTNRGSNDASTQWEGSTAQAHCNSIASYCSASASIKEITVQWSSVCNNSKTNTPDKTATAKVWLPAECQMGIAGSYASSQTEWNVGQTNQAAYAYYTDANSRKKFAGDANGNATTTTSWYWERSRYYNTNRANFVCGVDYDGNANYYYYGNTDGRLAPAFVIG